jgi:hypothetical protein
MPDANTAKIAALNDHARQTFRECRVVITQAVAELGKDDVDRILNEVRNYNDFTPINDPFLEHDFGSIQLGEKTIFWKIDYYDLDLHMHSPDPSDELSQHAYSLLCWRRNIEAKHRPSRHKQSKTALIKVSTASLSS